MDKQSEQTKNDSIELIKSQFGREAEKYAISRIHSNQEDLDYACEIINPKQDWICLDIATGAGHLAHTLARHSMKIIASDLTHEMLFQAQKIALEKGLHNMEFEEFDVHDIPHKDNKFDLVSSRIAPHHFYDITKGISEMIRVTKTNGYIFIEDTVSPENEEASTVFNRIEVLRDPSHIKDLSMKEWKQKFEDLGCEIISVKKRQKAWPLRWWTERMSTPHDHVKEIISLLENNFEQMKDEIGIENKNSNYANKIDFDSKIDSWQINPNNNIF